MALKMSPNLIFVVVLNIAHITVSSGLDFTETNPIIAEWKKEMQIDEENSVTPNPMLAERKEDENYVDAMQWRRQGLGGNPARNNPVDIQLPLANLDVRQIPALPTYAQVFAHFRYIRDTRFIYPGTIFPRRVSWLYPDDGCFARAEIAARQIVANNFTAPAKLYAFGNLRAYTGNHPAGVVRWWYHDVPIYRVGGTPYVLDAAIFPSRPLTLNEFNQAIGGGETTINYAICHFQTYGPHDNCYTPIPQNPTQIMRDQGTYLDLELTRLRQLGRDASSELGHSPPWLRAS